MKDHHFTFQDDCEIWLQDVLDNHYEEALSRATSLLSHCAEDENGCWVRATQRRPKIRFRGRQVSAARFVYCVFNKAIIPCSTVIRHRCHNERCCRPEHLLAGSAADNKRDDWDYWANGVDFDLL